MYELTCNQCAMSGTYVELERAMEAMREHHLTKQGHVCQLKADTELQKSA